MTATTHPRTHAYWIPGASGIVLEAALTKLASDPRPMRLTVEKVECDGVFRYSVKVDLLDEQSNQPP